MEPEQFSVAIFPFLKTSGPIRIGGFEFRSTTDLVPLPVGQMTAVNDLASMLFLRDDIRIASSAYTIAEPLGSLRPGPVVERLERVRSVVGYLYSSPHPILGNAFLPFDVASLAVVSPSKVSMYLVRPEHGTITAAGSSAPEPDAFGYVPGYEGILNFRQPLWLTAGSRLYGPKANMILNISQDLAVDFRNAETSRRADVRLLFALLDAPESPFSERVFTALDWYNEANTDDRSPDANLLSLAVAFETLLQLPGHEKTDRLVDAISLLLGRTERLAEWATQFYSARSQVAHEGRVRDWRFYTLGPPKKDGAAHSSGSLMTYGLQIFQLCMATVLTGASLAEETGLKERFVADGERYAAIATTLSGATGRADAQIAAIEPIVDALSLHRFAGSTGLTVDGVLHAVRAAAKTLLRCDLEFDDRLRSALDAVATSPRKDAFASLTALSDLTEVFKTYNLNAIGRPANVVALLASIAWQSTFMVYHQTAAARKRAAADVGDA